MTNKSSLILRVPVATILMAFAANCFLSYMWWAACYSAWYGIPKMAEQWKAAGFRASFNLWSFLALEFASVAVLSTLLPSSNRSGFLKYAPRTMLGLFITIFATALLALALSWVKQGMR